MPDVTISDLAPRPSTSSQPPTTDHTLTDCDLRQFTEHDLPFLDRLDQDPEMIGEFGWCGFQGTRFRRRFANDGLVTATATALAVVEPSGQLVGLVSWRPVNRGGPDIAAEVGVAICPEHRGRGLGSSAQARLVDYLFAHTRIHRLEALTDTYNHAERRALQRLGFCEEGTLRATVWRDGCWRDLVLFSLLRNESPTDAAQPAAGTDQPNTGNGPGTGGRRREA